MRDAPQGARPPSTTGEAVISAHEGDTDSQKSRRELDIRQARAEDAGAVSAVVTAAYGRYVERIGRRPAPMNEDYDEVVREHDVRVLVDGERVVGVLVLIPQVQGLLLDNVAVHPEYQGRGWGRRLLALAEEEARRGGATFIWLYTNQQMSEDIALYASLGYVEVERRTVQGYRRVHMRKEL